ncbi:hypothetical protein CO038_00600 [Candidatus Pacearchaeota archaeon CG_4_9_14_0_2_um_filter_39_13]|nr:hypothetical protein [Candidatus Pacearchaeota archaeon]OIO42988.1 MAG: hypothetical protein AUJ64_03385 [Candidatus Pacearchaeota archaeon CG1_02_39_14]PJC45055.1 MAG: hypothetical protein CO038_00600 [Candidatus Pacearchaeota archaeon CG_4_9_14_0_2_um_filter_39_13]
METQMIAKTILASFVALFAIVLAVVVMPSASAFGTIDGVYIDGVFYGNGENAGVFAGETLPVRVVFTASENQEDVRIVARIFGEAGLSEQTERFDVVQDSTYRKLLNIDLPFDIDPNESFILEITVESNSEEAASQQIMLEIQRDSYLVEILSVAGATEVAAGDTLSLDVVLKNRGRHEAEDTFVEASIPALGVTSRTFYGDLSSVDIDSESTPEKFDSAERRVFLRIPSNAATGVYDIEVTAFNDDSSTTVIKRVVVVGGLRTDIVSSGTTERVATGEKADFSMTIVNSGNTIKIYELVVDADAGLNVGLAESVVVVPAGSAKTVQITAESSEEGDYDFTVNVHSEGQVVQSKTFNAMVEGTSISSGNAAVVLTIILAIIFVVLLVVLIVLLTRKPETKEEFGESYY